MNIEQKEHFKNLFINLKNQLVNSTGSVEQVLTNQASGDIIDQTSNERDAQLKLKLMGRDKFLLNKVNRALDKIAAGTFGECEECGDNISMRRLHARPIATCCIACKEELEREENSRTYEKRSHTNGNKLSAHNKNVGFNHADGMDEKTNVVSIETFARKFDEKNAAF
ncbi:MULTISPECIES: TraR/DksA family transcriptional regulator [unclassified Halobacteriovorax]|uniref:TraR/DksA family transcriptional regulator n=1 Tax=unclassified Halobacteriovorax TaxID=2639665 RepID=UPI000EA36C44|nr:TraR/DksA family transcriptional regulator [Halobacteriovorax sp. BALOs_7]AYF44895.1 putative RNA polymerase-binding protein DksA [Halobacteriovorax sp. BALOs_7]